jgi:hypothetical protein
MTRRWRMARLAVVLLVNRILHRHLVAIDGPMVLAPTVVRVAARRHSPETAARTTTRGHYLHERPQSSLATLSCPKRDNTVVVVVVVGWQTPHHTANATTVLFFWAAVAIVAAVLVAVQGSDGEEPRRHADG